MLRDAQVKFTRELTGTLTIQTVTSAAIIVSGDSYSEPVALTPDEIVDGWEPLPIADLTEAHFEDLLSRSPELVILGTGASSQFPPRELVFAFAGVDEDGAPFELFLQIADLTEWPPSGSGEQVEATLGWG